AICFGSLQVKTPGCRSRALLRRVTSADHRRGALRDAARLRGAPGDGFLIASSTRQAPTPPCGNAAKTDRVPLLKGTKPEPPWPQHSPNLSHACPFPHNTLRRWPAPYPPTKARKGRVGAAQRKRCN